MASKDNDNPKTSPQETAMWVNVGDYDKLLKDGVVSINEVRVKLGFSRIEGADDLYRLTPSGWEHIGTAN